MNPSLIFNGLNDSQRQAVTSDGGHLLVAAGPGTGKTLTIVRRIAHLIKQGVDPGSILAVTFTNRAAREMKERAGELLGDAASRIFIGTFHLLGLRIIRESRSDDFAICGREEQVALLKSLAKEGSRKSAQLAERISRIKNFLDEPADDIAELVGAYQEALKRNNACDFDDLISVPIQLLEKAGEASVFRERFRHIIIDEYQDINPAQYRFLRLLAGSHASVCAVGDSDQAIYAFRGADIENFLNFEKDFPAAARVTLSENYRSTDTIVGASGRVIGNNRKRIEKKLASTRDAGAKITVLDLPDERAEAAAIINEIEARMGGTSHYRMAQGRSPHDSFEQNCRFSDFAVIYRTNAQARALEEAFAASGIPFQVMGKRNSLQRKEMEETIAYLRALALPDGAADPGSSETDRMERLLSEADLFDPRADCVTLMTMHTAKGLEFPVVFIAGCDEGLVPCTIMQDGIDIEEERRLFYVGMTRAKDELFLLHARNRFLFGQRLAPPPSPFLSEIPGELKECLVVADKIRKQKPEEKQMGLF